MGQAFALGEKKSYEIMKALDVDYVWVIFGGALGYQGDDLNKFTWMLQLANGVSDNSINEQDYIKDYS